MDMRVVRFVMESREPLQVLHGYLEIFRESLCLRPQHIPPAGAMVKAQAHGILAPQGNYTRPDVPLVLVQIVRHLLQVHLHTAVREQPMAAEAFRAGAGGYVFDVAAPALAGVGLPAAEFCNGICQ